MSSSPAQTKPPSTPSSRPSSSLSIGNQSSPSSSSPLTTVTLTPSPPPTSTFAKPQPNIDALLTPLLNQYRTLIHTSTTSRPLTKTLYIAFNRLPDDILRRMDNPDYVEYLLGDDEEKEGMDRGRREELLEVFGVVVRVVGEVQGEMGEGRGRGRKARREGMGKRARGLKCRGQDARLS
ncbi:hypothetical protein PMZ80_008287 [Knufia obscura]|uniref:Uncharacterized protein n=2 Tax=Knufia TaxID=430999 RepID=A0AAN8EJQ2_9EURO|nr:hypothetical protein PMZ80_008287 [Knufia obscura]KAK5956988.1 hypothetical protein OHC33_001357 [Knufia fluminis]